MSYGTISKGLPEITKIRRGTSDPNSIKTPLLPRASADCCAAAGCSASAGEEKRVPSKGAAHQFPVWQIVQLEDSISALALLENNKGDVDSSDERGMTALHFAFRDSKLGIVKNLLEMGADLSRIPLEQIIYNYESDIALTFLETFTGNVNKYPGKKEWSETLLGKAIEDASLSVVEKLLKMGADPNKKSHSWPPLCIATRLNNLEIVEKLLEKGADPNVGVGHPDEGNSLHTCVCFGSPSILELLLDAGADPNKKDEYEKTPLQYAIEWLDPKDGPEYGTFINMLIKKGADLKHLPLSTIIELDSKHNFETGIDKDIAFNFFKNFKEDVNKSEACGITPLYKAVSLSNERVVELLLNKGANPDQAKNDGTTPLAMAIKADNQHIIDLLNKARLNQNN